LIELVDLFGEKLLSPHKVYSLLKY